MAARGGDAVSEIVGRLKRDNPGVRDAEVTNYLVTLYCPVVDRNHSLSEEEKRARLLAFSSRVMQELAGH